MRNFDPINLRVWIAETFDCDDFAQVLEGKVNGFFPGIALGTLWYGDKARLFVRRGRKAAGLRNKTAELPKDKPLVSSAFLLL